MRQVDLIVMHGRTGTSEVERLVDDARAAIARDLVDKALASGAFASIIVSTNDPALAEDARRASLGRGRAGSPGRAVSLWASLAGPDRQAPVRARGLSRRRKRASLVCLDDLRELAERVRAADRLFVANNFYSVDFCAFTPASALLDRRAADQGQ